MPPSNLAVAVENGFANATSYDTYRPSYPDEAVAKLLEHLGVLNVPNARILDLAAGTGKMTSLLAARPEAYDIVAVEPHAEMRMVLEKKGLKGVKVMNGTAEDMQGVANDWADAVVVAQGFHWFANIESLQEIHRVLGPGCTLGLIWNIEDYNSRTDWKASTIMEAKLKDIVWSHQETSKDPRFRHNEWPKVFDAQLKTTPVTIQLADPLFSLPLGEDMVEWTVWLAKDAVWDRFSTLSHMAVLEGSEREDTKKAVYDAMEADGVEKNEKGEIALHGKTVSYWTTAIPSNTLKSGG